MGFGLCTQERALDQEWTASIQTLSQQPCPHWKKQHHIMQCQFLIFSSLSENLFLPTCYHQQIFKRLEHIHTQNHLLTLISMQTHITYGTQAKSFSFLSVLQDHYIQLWNTMRMSKWQNFSFHYENVLIFSGQQSHIC